MGAVSRILIALSLLGALRAEEALPRRDPGEPLDFEPNLQLYNVPEEPAQATPQLLLRGEREVERARLKEERWKTLQQRGVVSKAEAERASGQAAEAIHKLAQARVRYWQEQVEALRGKAEKGESSRDLLITAEASLVNAERLAADAKIMFYRRALEIAEAHLERQQRLLALGLGSKAEVQRASTAREKWRELAK